MAFNAGHEVPVTFGWVIRVVSSWVARGDNPSLCPSRLLRTLAIAGPRCGVATFRKESLGIVPGRFCTPVFAILFLVRPGAPSSFLFYACDSLDSAFVFNPEVSLTQIWGHQMTSAKMRLLQSGSAHTPMSLRIIPSTLCY